MAKRVSAADFVAFLKERIKAKDGYIMGATGQDPKKWSKTSWWFAQYDPNSSSKGSSASSANHKKALYWRENAERVWDCNGLAEGFYKDKTGIDINTKARYNYAGWCGKKGSGKIPTEYRQAGVAVFSGKTAATITHVGYLLEPVNAGNPAGDWYVGEARGVSYGVVKTKLNSRNWNFWGVMDKYFEYEDTEPDLGYGLGDRTLKKGIEGADVEELQEKLIALGYKLPKYGADGDFGTETENAVKEFQQANGLTVDGIVGKATFAALEADEKKKVCPTCGQTIK